MTEQEMVNQICQHANPYFLEKVRRLASALQEESYQRGFAEGKAAPRPRGRKPKKVEADSDPGWPDEV